MKSEKQLRGERNPGGKKGVQEKEKERDQDGNDPGAGGGERGMKSATFFLSARNRKCTKRK